MFSSPLPTIYKMPYYCTVPRCTSMAGKAKNVSFHQFPRDEELAKIWNRILRRGKPYTKYSKVCSLHFTSDDYTITGLGRNKGQWKTLRKDAIPSQNLPSDSPITTQESKNAGTWVMDNISSELMDSQVHQMAQAIYTQTLLAVQASGALNLGMATACNEADTLPNGDDSTSGSSNSSGHFSETIKQFEHLIYRNNINHKLNPDLTKTSIHNQYINMFSSESNKKEKAQEFSMKHTYKCVECSKCFKDPDVYVLHKRIHMPKNIGENGEVFKNTFPKRMFSEKENFDGNVGNNLICVSSPEETLRANPILANLLNSTMPQTLHKGEDMQKFDNKSVTNIENQIMMDLAANSKNNNCRNLLTSPNTILSKDNIGVNDDNSIRVEDDNSSIDSNAEDEAMDEETLFTKPYKLSLVRDSEVNSICDNKECNESMNSYSINIDKTSNIRL